MEHSQQDSQESDVLRISRRSVYGIILAMVSLASAVGVAYLNNRPTLIVDAPDRYTGTQGRALEARNTILEAKFIDLEDLVDTIAFNITDIQHDQANCREWRDGFAREWGDHKEYSRKVVIELTNDITRNQQALKSMEYLLGECLQATRIRRQQ